MFAPSHGCSTVLHVMSIAWPTPAACRRPFAWALWSVGGAKTLNLGSSKAARHAVKEVDHERLTKEWW
jgi:hypothetical protein